MPELGPSGSVRGTPSNGRPYRDTCADSADDDKRTNRLWAPAPQHEPLAVPNLNQRIRVGTDRDGAASCGSKTLPWTAGMRKKRPCLDGSANG
jgi:hypothetical protein